MNDFIIVNDPYRGVHLEHKNGFKYLSKQFVNGKWRYIYNTLSTKIRGYSKEGNLKDRGYSSSTSGTNTQNLRDRGYSNSRGISNTYLYEGVYNKNALRKRGYANSRTDGAAGANYWEMVNKKSLRNQGYANSRTDGSAGASYEALVKKSNDRKELMKKINQGSKIVSDLFKKLKKENK